MFERLKKLYSGKGKLKLSKEGLKNAVEKGYITAEQYKEITGEDYE